MRSPTRSSTKRAAAAFPPDLLGTSYPDLDEPILTRTKSALEAKVEELRQAVGISDTVLADAVRARAHELEEKRQNRQVERTAVATAAMFEATEDATKQAAAAAREERKQRRRQVARLRSALWSRKPELIDELAAIRVQVIDREVGASVVAHDAAAKQRTDMLNAYEEAYLEAYRIADSNYQYYGKIKPTAGAARPSMLAHDPPMAEGGGGLWRDVAETQTRATFESMRRATTIAQGRLVEASQQAGLQARAALREWADKRARRDRTADEAHNAAALERAHQEETISTAREQAAKQSVRNRLLGQARFAISAFEQANQADAATQTAGGETLTEADRDLRARFLASGGDPSDPMTAVAAAIKRDVLGTGGDSRMAESAREIHQKVIEKRPTSEADVNRLADVVFPGGSGKLANRASKLRKAFETWTGTDEDATYAALEGLDEVQAHLLRQRYQSKYKESLDGRIRSEMSGAEKRRALGLLEVDPVKTSKAMIELSDGWFSDDKDLAISALERLPRGLAAEVATPDTMATLRKVMGGDVRRVHYGNWVEDNRGMQQVAMLLEMDRIHAEQQPGTPPSQEMLDLQARIDAVAFDRALRNNDQGDVDRMTAVVTRMREEMQRDPRTRDLPGPEFDTELRRRTRRMEIQYGKLFGEEIGGPPDSALNRAIGQAMIWQDRVDFGRALVKVDREGELAARIQLSWQDSFIAYDSDINKALALNFDRAMSEVQRDPALQRQVEALAQQKIETYRARKQQRGEGPLTPPEIQAYRDEARHEVAMQLAADTFGGIADRFNTNYGERWRRFGDPRKSGLENMLIATTQFSGEDEALARMRNGGGLQWHEQVYFGVSGYGMDRSAVEAVEGKTREQLDRIAASYRSDFHEGMEDRLLDEASGRDAFDVKEALRGVPKNDQEMIDKLERRLAYEENTYFSGAQYAVGQAVFGFDDRDPRGGGRRRARGDAVRGPPGPGTVPGSRPGTSERRRGADPACRVRLLQPGDRDVHLRRRLSHCRRRLRRRPGQDHRNGRCARRRRRRHRRLRWHCGAGARRARRFARGHRGDDRDQVHAAR